MMPTSSRRMRAARAAERLRVETDMFARELKWAVDQIEQDQEIKDYVDGNSISVCVCACVSVCVCVCVCVCCV
jgi:hypothetical protein